MSENSILGLITLQLSVKDDVTGLFRLSHDSNWNFTCNTMASMQHFFPNLRMILVCPLDSQIWECSYDKNVRVQDLSTAKVNWDRIHIFPIYYSPYIFLSRHHFSSEKLKDIPGIKNLSFVWINDPCHVLAWKTAIHYENNTHQPVYISYNNWIDDPLSPRIPKELSFLISQVEGAYHSDLSLFNSNFAIEQFIRAARTTFNFEWIDKHIDSKCYKSPPGIDLAVVDETQTPRDIKEVLPGIQRKIKIIFNHRLNDLNFYKSNWKTVFDLLRSLTGKGYEFDVTCTDTSNLDNFNRIQQEYPFLRLENFETYRDYLKALWESDLALALFKEPGMWSLSLLEAMVTQCATIVPNHSGYLEMVDARYPAKVDPSNPYEAYSLVEKLITDRTFYNDVVNAGSNFARSYFSNNKVLEDVVSKLETHFYSSKDTR